MSDLSNKIIGSGLVLEGIEVEKLEKKVQELTDILSSGKPVCPFCKIAMTPINYSGYYDEFSYWECDCGNFPNGEKRSGAYA